MREPQPGVHIAAGVAADGARYEIIDVPNTLAAKAGGFRAAHVNSAVVAAQLDRLAQGYPELIRADVEQLPLLWDRMIAAAGDVAAETELFRIAHDLAGQSATFGYPLVAAIAGSLRVLITGGAAQRRRAHPAVAAHLRALSQVVRFAVKGDGGADGKKVLQMLHAAVLDCLS